MIAHSLLIGVVVAFVLVANSNRVLGVGEKTAEDRAQVVRSFELIDQAMADPSDPRNNHDEAAETVVDLVNEYTNHIDSLLPPDALERIFKWIRSSDILIRTSGWKIMERLACKPEYAKEAMDQGLIDDILRSIQTATGDEEYYALNTLSSLILSGYYTTEDSQFVRETIIPILEYRLSHESALAAQKAARSISDIVKFNEDSLSQYLVESGVVGRVIAKIGSRSSRMAESDSYLFDFVGFIVQHVPQFKSDIATLDIVPRVYESLSKYSDRVPDAIIILSHGLSMLSKLVAGSADAAVELIGQGLPMLVHEALRGYDDHLVKYWAVQVLYEINKLDQPEQMEAFRKLPSIAISLQTYKKKVEAENRRNKDFVLVEIDKVLSALTVS